MVNLEDNKRVITGLINFLQINSCYYIGIFLNTENVN